MYIIMEYADAGDLNGRIRAQRRPFSESVIVGYFCQLCLAIKHLHDRKCLHRDIKAENVFLTSEGRIKLGDFGISKLLPSTFACAITRIGTPYYLSPEICMNRPYNTASDMWSLGVCLYEMCMLQHPFDASSMESLLKKIVRVPHRPLHAFYHPDLRSLVDALMNKNPAKRPSIGEVLRVPIVHREIGKWLTKKQIEAEFLFAGLGAAASPTAADASSALSAPTAAAASAAVDLSIASTVTGLPSPHASPVSAGSSLEESESPGRQVSPLPRREQKDKETQPQQQRVQSAAATPVPAVAAVPVSSPAPTVVKPVASRRPAAPAAAVGSSSGTSASRPGSSSSGKAKADDTLQWLRAAEEKMKAQEEKRRAMQDAKAAAPPMPQRAPAPQPPTSAGSRGKPAAADSGSLQQQQEREEKQPSRLASSPAAELAPVPASSIFTPSFRAARPMPDLIPGSQPSSPTQSRRELQQAGQSQPPSPVLRSREAAGGVAAFRVQVAASAGVRVGLGRDGVAVVHRRGVSSAASVGLDDGRRVSVKTALAAAKPAGRV